MRNLRLFDPPMPTDDDTMKAPAVNELEAIRAELLIANEQIDALSERCSAKDRGIETLRAALAEEKLRVAEAREVRADREPWIWSDDDTAKTVDELGNRMVVRITGGHLRALIRNAVAAAEAERLASAPVVADARAKDPRLPCSETVERHSWDELREAGLLWVANTVLHWFGWCIVVATDDETGQVVEAYPARTRWRGFPAENNERGIRRLTGWLASAGSSLRSEIEDDGDADPGKGSGPT